MDVAAIFQFLRELSRHNDREWFNAHKDWYKQAKKGIWLGAFAMIVYGSSVSSGTRKKKVVWKQIKRNKK